MSGIPAVRNELFRLYEHYVGEPDSTKDVYGYWLFILGYLVGAAGVFAFVVGYASGAGTYSLIRLSAIPAATGLSLSLFGIVLMLPVRRRGIQASAVGLVVSLVGVAAFGVVYPNDWRGYGADWSAQVIATYAMGLVIIAGVTALVPVVTGRKGMFVEEEGATEEPPILTGDALEGAQFAAFRDEAGDWVWRVLHLEALAKSEGSTRTRPDAEAGIERVQSQIGSAGLMELTTSAFRLYEDQEGGWRWTLARDDGSVVASCGEQFDDRGDVEESVSFLKDRGPRADVIEIEDAAFTFHEDRDRWTWTLLDDDRTPLAVSDEEFSSRERAEASTRTFAERFDRARTLDVEGFGVELRERGEAWAFRFVDDGDEVLAESTDDFDSRRDVEESVEALLPALESGAITVAGEPTYELYESGGAWQFRLVDRNEHVVARNPSGTETREAVTSASDRFGASAPDADVVEIDEAEYELYPADWAPKATDAAVGGPPATIDEVEAVPDGGTDAAAPGRTDGVDVDVDEPAVEAAPEGWRWRLVTEGRDVVAASTVRHEDVETATAAIDRMREQAREADLIEFDEAAFQVYEADSGEWRWRLVDEDGNVLADSGEEHASRGDAAEAMLTLKEQAPDADVLEIDTAAFELFVDDEGAWGWRLIDEAGKLVAEDPTTHPTRAAAREAMDRLLAHLESDVRTMERAIFQTYAAEEWRWRFVLPSGEVVAVSENAHPTRDELRDGLADVRRAAASDRRHTIGDVTAQLYEGGGSWRFRLRARDRRVVADAAVSYDDREAATAAVRDLQAHAETAQIFAIETAAIRLSEDDGWTWDLIDRDRTVFASAPESAPTPTKTDLEAAVDDVRRLAPLAGRVDFDVASFELVADGDGQWRFQLIDEDGRVVATGTETYDSSGVAREAVTDVRELIERASILEIDGVSFELHTAEDGWVWRLVDEHGVTMAESTRTYETRTRAREAMNAVKGHAPDGWITFTE